MPDKYTTTETPGHAFVGLCCPKCDYNLTGTTRPRCPECGVTFDPAELRPPKSGWRGKPSWRVTLASLLLAIYLPNTWIFWIDYTWQGGYRMIWAKLFPVQPSLLPVAWCMWLTGINNRVDDTLGIAILGFVTAAMVAACAVIGRRSRVWLLVVCVAMLMLQVFNALGSYALFRM